ncbi:MAG TPA: hypothetical protein DIW07_13825 [Lachnospiraceae bacterium]|jgi:two-component system response regulator YesN|nr:hypothetical protein [Lachnospiraceae bacterium]HCR84459.1 hypothetical protein [Lachnospiraceae bacterium]
MRVLIADDEIKVCKLIQHLIDWDEFDMDIIGVANDGKAALEAICDRHPDIVITDIRMPNCDGLELIKRSKELFPDISFIVVSGYSQFEYAQQAIKYGVKDYLLKPLKKRELENVLNGIRGEYESLLEEVKEREKINFMVNTSKAQMKENFLAQLLLDQTNLSALKSIGIEDINKKYACSFREGYFNIARLHPYFGGNSVTSDTIHFYLSKMNQLTKEKMSVLCEEVICTVYEEEVVCLFNVITPDSFKIERQLKHVKIDMSNLSCMIEDVKVIVGIGGIVQDICHIESCIWESDSALLNRMGKKVPYCIFYAPDEEEKIQSTDFIDMQKRSDILACQERLDIEGVKKQVLSLKKKLMPYRSNGKLIFKCYCELIEILQFGMKSFDIILFPDYLKQYRRMRTYEDVFNWIIAKIEEGYQLYTENKKEAVSRPVRDAKQYIYDHFSQNITLEKVSDQIGFNPAYFSTLFKKETGQNFLEYVTELRIQKAKNYLIQTDYDVAEIASSVGYGDLKYFSRLFKKNTGLNPSDFRRLYN